MTSKIELAEAAVAEAQAAHADASRDFAANDFELQAATMARGRLSPKLDDAECEARLENANDRLRSLYARAVDIAKTYRRQHRLENFIDDCEVAREKAKLAMRDTGAALEQANRHLLDAQAEELRPQHQAAVIRVVKAMDELGKALCQERDVRGQLPEHHLLPSAAVRHLGYTDDINSPISWWFERQKQIGNIPTPSIKKKAA